MKFVHKNKIIIIIFGLALVLGAFFAVLAIIFIKEIEKLPARRIEPAPLSREKLGSILPDRVSLPITQNYIDLDGDGADEFVIGFGEAVSSNLVTITKPRFLMYRYLNKAWVLEDEFDFPIGDRFYTNGGEWNSLRGAPSFEKKDIDDDGHEEIFARIDVGSEFFHAKAIIVLRDDKLVWLPMVKKSRSVLPIFLEGNTTSEAHRLLLEGVREREGLAIISAYGFLNPQDQAQEWIYEAYVEQNGIYEYSAEKSEEVASQNR